MDERAAFSRVVTTIYMRNWDRANPDQPTFEIENEKYLSVRQVCDRVRNLDEPLPKDEAGNMKNELFEILHRWSDSDLTSDLRRRETYSIAAACLSTYIERRLGEVFQIDDEPPSAP